MFKWLHSKRSAELSHTVESQAPVAVDTYLARQPIFDRSLRVVAYELLFRSDSSNRANIVNPAQATAQLLLNACVSIGLPNLVGSCQAFVNLPREFLTGEIPLPINSEQLVLEILEDVVIDAELIAGVGKLRELGHILALDDVIYEPRLEPLLQLAHIVKMELPKLPREDWESHLQRFRQYPVRILAEKVETEAEFELCRDLGFDLFQGYFFCRPKMIPGRQLHPAQSAVLRLLGQLSNPTISMAAIEEIFRADVALSYKLLKYINSSKFGMRRQIDSLRQAIQLIGTQGVRTIAMLVAVGGLESQRPELLAMTIRRALHCEKLARGLATVDSGECFTAGLISALDTLLGKPLPEIVSELSVSDSISHAVLQHAGPIGEVVGCAMAHDRLEGDAVPCGSLTAQAVLDAFIDSIVETDQLLATSRT